MALGLGKIYGGAGALASVGPIVTAVLAAAWPDAPPGVGEGITAAVTGIAMLIAVYLAPAGER